MKSVTFALGAAAILIAAAAHAEERVTLNVRPGVETRFLFEPAANPVAQVLLFEGGQGTIGGGGRRFFGFLEGSRKLFLPHGISTAMFEPPSDHAKGMPVQHRFSDEHTRDADAIIAWLRQKSAAPVWLVGVSRGTQSVTWLGSQVKEPVAGIVLASSLTNGRFGLANLGIEKIKVPSLVLHHKWDGCESCPPSGVQTIDKLLPAGTKREIKLFSGGLNAGKDPCLPGTYHTFHRIEGEVVAAIADFVKANPPR